MGVRRRKERRGINPQTREEMIIPATDVPVISFGASLKQSVAKKKKLKTFVPKGKKPASKSGKKVTAKKEASKKDTRKPLRKCWRETNETLPYLYTSSRVVI